MDLLSPDSGTIFWTVLTFIILLLVLKKFAWKPILKTLEDRENKIKVALYQAEQTQKEAEKLLKNQREILTKARQESAETINAAKKSAEITRKEIIDQTQIEAENLLKQAKQEIEISKQTALDELKKYAVDLSFAAAQKVISETLTKEQHLQLIEKSIEELSRAK